MKVIHRIAILAAVALIVASLSQVGAVCANARAIDGCSPSCQYFLSPGVGITGNFWSFGTGNPTVGAGDDNGSNLSNGNANSNDDWLLGPPGGNRYIGGFWSVAGVDGCIDLAPAPHRTVVLLTAADAPASEAATTKGYFALQCKETDANGNYALGALGPAVFAQIPYPRVTSSNRVDTVSVHANVNGPLANISGGVTADPSCTNLITGYRLCTQVRDNGLGEPGDRSRGAGWTCGNVVSGAGTPTSVDVPCGGPSRSVYLATSLVFDSGFETSFVGQHVRIPCDPTLSDRPGNFKLIKKPTRTHTPRR